MSTRCVGTTKAGEPCRNSPTGSAPYCRRHLDGGGAYLDAIVDVWLGDGDARCPRCHRDDPHEGVRMHYSLATPPVCRRCEPYVHLEYAEALTLWRYHVEARLPWNQVALIQRALGSIEAWPTWFGDMEHPPPCPGRDCPWPLHEWRLTDESDEDEA